MAIAIDSTSSSGNNSGGASATWSHTCSGSNRMLMVGATQDGGVTISGATYAGVAMTLVNSVTDGNRSAYLFYLINPASGANNVVVTRSSGANTLDTTAASYTGVKQSAQPDNNVTSTSTSDNLSVNITTNTDDCWLVCQTRFDGGNQKAGTNNFARVAGGIDGQQFGLWDSNASVGAAGVKAMAWSGTGLTNTKLVIASIAAAPPVALSMAADQGSYTLTGVAAIVGRIMTLIASAASYILSGKDISMRFSGWTEQTKVSTTFTNSQTKTSDSWSEQSK